MTITIELNPEIEQRLSARARGISLDTVLQEIVSEQARVITSPAVVAPGKTLKHPALHLGAMGSLHRCDIYDDVS